MNITKQAVIDELKAAGYNTKQVSVRSDRGGLDQSITLTVRHPSVSYPRLEEIEKKYRYEDRDERTFEILRGGNTYINIELTDEVQRAWAEKYLALVVSAISLLVGEQHRVPIDDRFTISRIVPQGFRIWDEFYSWLPTTYYRSVDIAVDLYLLTTGIQGRVTRTAVHRYWFRTLLNDENAWKNEAGEYNLTAMREDAARQFHCLSEGGPTETEADILSWAVEFTKTLRQ